MNRANRNLRSELKMIVKEACGSNDNARRATRRVQELRRKIECWKHFCHCGKLVAPELVLDERFPAVGGFVREFFHLR
jgi:hypothetical protein